MRRVGGLGGFDEAGAWESGLGRQAPGLLTAGNTRGKALLTRRYGQRGGRKKDLSEENSGELHADRELGCQAGAERRSLELRVLVTASQYSKPLYALNTAVSRHPS